VYLVKENHEAVPAIYDSDNFPHEPFRSVWVDGVGIGHLTGEGVRQRGRKIVVASKWQKGVDNKWAGPRTTSFPCDIPWKVGGMVMRMDEMSIHRPFPRLLSRCCAPDLCNVDANEVI